MRDILIILTLMALIPVALLRPYIGVSLWAWTAFIDPNAYAYGFAAGLPINKIITGATVLGALAARESRTVRWDAITVMILVLFVHGTVSYWLGEENSAAIGVFDKFWKECALCLFINMFITDRLRLHTLLVTCSIGIGLHGVAEGSKFILSGGAHHVADAAVGGGDNNQFALGMLMILPILYYLSRQSSNILVRNGWLVATVLTALSVVATWSRGGFAGLVVLGVSLALTSANKVRSLLVVVAIGAVIMSVASAQWYGRISTINEAESDDSFLGRVYAWEVSFEAAKQHPILGIGFHGVQEPSLFREYSANVPTPTGLATKPGAKAAHSIFFEILGDLGFVGLAMFLSLLWLGFYYTNKAIRFSKSKPDLKWIYELALNFRLILIVYIVSGSLLSMAYFEFFYVVLSIIAILAYFCSELAKEEGRPRIAIPAVASSIPAMTATPALPMQK